MRIVAIVVIAAACSHAAPPAAPASNHAAPVEPAAATTHMYVRVAPLYDDCKAMHHIAVLLDDELQLTVETHSECSPPPQTVNGRTVYVNSPHPYYTDSRRFDVSPGPHIIKVVDRETLHAGEVGDEFPVYSRGGDHRLLDLVGVGAKDEELHMFQITYDPGSSID